ncbi:hypothetical protein NS341_13485, partial [Staphylococcus xylosus]
LADGDEAVDLAQLDGRGAGRGGGLRDQAAAAVELVGAFQPRGEVHGIAEHRVAHHEFGADAADQRFAGGDADPDVAVGRDRAHAEQLGQILAELVDLADHVDGGKRSQMGLLGLLDEGRPPIGHDGVADILVDDAAMGVDRRRHRRQIEVHDLDQAARRHAFAQAGEALHVAEHHRHDAALSFGCGDCRLLEQALGDCLLHPSDAADELTRIDLGSR